MTTRNAHPADIAEAGSAEVVAAYDSGLAYARGLKVGDTFNGARPAGEARGLAGMALSAFVGGALEELEHMQIYSSHDSNVLTRVERPA